VTDEGDSANFFDFALGKLGGVDVLVNNAGVAGPTGPLEELDAGAWKFCVEANLFSAFLHSKLAIPHMKKQKSGLIVNLSSTAGLYGYPLRTPYCSAKWAIIGLTKSMAMKLGSFGVKV
jgi:NAD(P)-dependent dehydrogenase (short-subunit alcohol dehydrogenase family)